MKTTAEMIEVMQAFERGAEIQCKYRDDDDDWTPMPSPSWNWCGCDYRIKPREPKVIWVNEYDDDYLAYPTEIGARNNGAHARRTAVKYIEVIE